MRSTHLLALFISSLSLVSTALAQDEANTEGRPASEAAAPLDEPSEPTGEGIAKADDIAEAEDSFHAGDEAFDVQKYQLALQYFRESYSLVKSPNTRLMIARSLLELGRLDESYDEYVGLMQLPADEQQYARTRSIARKERSALLSRLGWLTLNVDDLPEGTVFEVDGRPREADGELRAIPVTPGRSKVTAVTPQGEEAHAVIHLAAGRQVEVGLRLGETITIDAEQEEEPLQQSDAPTVAEEPKPHSTSPPSLRPYAIGSAVVGAVGLGLFAAYGTKSRRTFNGLRDDCDDGSCPAQSQSEIDSGKRAQTTANVGLALGILGVAGATTLLVLDARRRQVAVGVGPGRISIRGTF